MAAVSFDEALKMTATQDPLVHTAHLHENQWSIGQATNGGLLTALVLKSAYLALLNVHPNGTAPQYPHPLTSSLQFLRVAGYGKRYFHVSINKTSKQYAHVTIVVTESMQRMHNDVLITATSWFGNLKGDPKAWRYRVKGTDLDMTTVKPRKELTHKLLSVPEKMRSSLSLYDSVELLFDVHSNEKERAWVSFQDGRLMDDVWAIILATDAMTPHPMIILGNKTGKIERTGEYWCPTMSLELNIHGLPERGDESVVVEMQTVLASNGTFEETCKTFNKDGKLLVSGRQYAGIVSMSRAVAKSKL
jgi:hypothetical protein